MMNQLEAEERLGSDMNPEDELTLLKLENERPLHELKRKYHDVSEEYSSGESTVGKRTSAWDESGFKADSIEECREKEQAHEIDTALVTRPFLIPSRVKLREYQHTGLSWLVSLQTRRLNGILADGKIHICFLLLVVYSMLTTVFTSKRWDLVK
jgi:SNF2 family DNA or RNA helicase